jgi:hypothetical protein
MGPDTKTLRGRFVSLFDPELAVRREVVLSPGSRWFLFDLDKLRSREPTIVASACKALPTPPADRRHHWQVEGVAGTPAVVLLHARRAPQQVTLAGSPLEQCRWDPDTRLTWIRFTNTSGPRELTIRF